MQNKYVEFLNACLENDQDLMHLLISQNINYIEATNFAIENNQDKFLNALFIQENCFQYKISDLFNFLDIAAYNDNLSAFKLAEEKIKKKIAVTKENSYSFYTVSLSLAISNEHWSIVEYIESTGFSKEKMKNKINDKKLDKYILYQTMQDLLSDKEVKTNKNKI